MKKKMKAAVKIYRVFPQMGQLADMAKGDQKWFTKEEIPNALIVDREIKNRFNPDRKKFDVLVGTKGVLIRRTA